jgi:hypothetical protein
MVTHAGNSEVASLSFDVKEINVGKIAQGKPVTAQFHITNTGNSASTITQTKTGCTCTVVNTRAGNEGLIVESGKSEDLKVQIDTTRKKGPFTERIFVAWKYQNQEYSQLLEVKGVATDEGMLQAAPAVLHLAKIETGAAFSYSLNIKPIGEAQGLTIDKVDAPAWIKSSITQRSKSEWLLEVKGNAPDNMGRLFTTITVITNSKDFPKLEIPVVGYITGPLRVEPADLVWIVEKDSSEAGAILKMKDGSSVTDVSFGNDFPEGFEWRQESAKDGSTIKISLRMKPNAQVRNIESWNQKITAKCAGKTYETEINVVAINKTQ